MGESKPMPLFQKSAFLSQKHRYFTQVYIIICQFDRLRLRSSKVRERGRRRIREINLEQTPTSSEIAASHCYKLSGKKKKNNNSDQFATTGEPSSGWVNYSRNTLKTASTVWLCAQVGDLPKRFLLLPLPSTPLQQEEGMFFVLFDFFWPLCSHLCTDQWQTGELPCCLYVWCVTQLPSKKVLYFSPLSLFNSL